MAVRRVVRDYHPNARSPFVTREGRLQYVPATGIMVRCNVFASGYERGEMVPHARGYGEG